MSEPTEDDVNQIVTQAQQLDEWKQAILADLRANGQDTDGIRMIVSHRTTSGGYTATELTTPGREPGEPPSDGEPDAR